MLAVFSLLETQSHLRAKFFSLSHDVVMCDVDRDVSIAYC